MAREDDGGGRYPRDLPSAGDQVEVDRDALRDVAKKLQADLDDLNSWNSGSLKDLQDNEQGLVPEDALGNYNAGRQIWQTFRGAYSMIGSTYGEFLTSYQQVVTAIKQTAEGYQRAEDATADAANRANPGGGGQAGGGSGGGGGGAW